MKEWQLQQDKRRSRTPSHSLQFLATTPDNPPERRRQLLDSLSSHDHLPPFKRAHKERHRNTAEWIFDTAEFC